MSSINTIAFIGLGVMGKPMCSNLIKAGFSCRVFDVDKNNIDTLVNLGALSSMSPEDCVKDCDMVITMLPSGDIVKEVIFGVSGLINTLSKQSIVVDMSTISPADTDEINTRLTSQGYRFADAPVGRQVEHAVSGELLIMIGAQEADYQPIEPALSEMGSTLVHCGAPGNGSRMKIVNNFMSISINVNTAEALIMAEKSGLDVGLAMDVMKGTVAGNGHMGTTYPNKVLKGDVKPGFALRLAHKDLKLAIELAEQIKIDIPMGMTAFQCYDQAMAECGHLDWTALYQHLKQRTGKYDEQ